MLQPLDCRLALPLLLALLQAGASLGTMDYRSYASMIADAKQYFTASGVFILRYEEELDTLREASESGSLIGQLSRLGVSAQSISHSGRLELRLERERQSLFVALLDSAKAFEGFRLASAGRDMSRGFFLVLFLAEELAELCRAPPGNVFHLEFDSQVIVACHAGARLRRWYALDDNRTLALDLASWADGLGFYDFNERYSDERYQLGGKTLKIGTVKNVETFGEYNKFSKMAKYFADVLSELQVCMNFSVSREAEEDEVSRWTYLIDSVVENRTDMVVAPITISKLRLDIIDFSKPLLLSSNRIYLRQPDSVRVQWSSYFRAFTLTSWSLIALLLIAASLMTAFIRAIISNTTFIHLSVHYVLENFINVWGIYCQQGMSEVPSATPLRLAYFSTLLLTLIIWAIYSASITSYLTVRVPSLPFSTIDGLVRHGSYKLIVLQNSSDHANIMEGKNPTLSKLQPLMKKSKELPTNPFAAFQQVCREKIGFYASEAVLNDVGDLVPCPLTYIETGQFECLAMVLAKHSSYIAPINYNLQRLEDTGVMQKLKKWYFHQKENPAIGSSHSPVGLWGVIPLLAIYASGFGLSIFVFSLENICYGRKRRNRSRMIGSSISDESLPH